MAYHNKKTISILNTMSLIANELDLSFQNKDIEEEYKTHKEQELYSNIRILSLVTSGTSFFWAWFQYDVLTVGYFIVFAFNLVLSYKNMEMSENLLYFVS